MRNSARACTLSQHLFGACTLPAVRFCTLSCAFPTFSPLRSFRTAALRKFRCELALRAQRARSSESRQMSLAHALDLNLSVAKNVRLLNISKRDNLLQFFCLFCSIPSVDIEAFICLRRPMMWCVTFPFRATQKRKHRRTVRCRTVSVCWTI